MIDEYSSIEVSELKKTKADDPESGKEEKDKPKFKTKKAVME